MLSPVKIFEQKKKKKKTFIIYLCIFFFKFKLIFFFSIYLKEKNWFKSQKVLFLWNLLWDSSISKRDENNRNGLWELIWTNFFLLTFCFFKLSTVLLPISLSLILHTLTSALNNKHYQFFQTSLNSETLVLGGKNL